MAGKHSSSAWPVASAQCTLVLLLPQGLRWPLQSDWRGESLSWLHEFITGHKCGVMIITCKVAVFSEAKGSLPYRVKCHWVSGQARPTQGHQGSCALLCLQWPLVGKFFKHWRGEMTAPSKSSFFCFLFFLSIAQLMGVSAEYLWKVFTRNCQGILENLGSFIGSKGKPQWLSGKESACQCRRHTSGSGSIPGSGRSSGVGNGNPLQNYWLGNPMDRGAWQATVQRVANELNTT